MNLQEILSEKAESDEEKRAAQKIVRLLHKFTVRQAIEVLELTEKIQKILEEAKVDSLGAGEEVR